MAAKGNHSRVEDSDEEEEEESHADQEEAPGQLKVTSSEEESKVDPEQLHEKLQRAG
eukprot:CAMPEP_0119101098 /NCGR_PEP_ID=MMETSP1180-20130426/235_1 /TAXON_ID=3052 ORGANISM="Chlamydomonas cf sp, Strain CCMP681" /NCGR_SAMPLE_ID=MMETSP1180 /ASSEMBLY_ACC=CAM_ASM_000741 /LENGTH=56 /DNA_ID=CAMNT_0007085149 /DNA_START=17 /DNA_END=188 /DNA_ORIENTATION=-